MDPRRWKLQDILEQTCPNIYFSPPENVKLVYPCIIYERNDIDGDYADNHFYMKKTGYAITVIDEDPDSTLYEELLNKLEYARFDRHADIDGLSHDYLNVYF